MGRNSKQRRDAKRRREAGRRGPHPRNESFGAAGSGGWSGGGGAWPGEGFGDPGNALAFADLLVTAEVRRIMAKTVTDAELAGCAELLRLRAAPVPASFLAQALHDLLANLLKGALDSGWEPRDVDEVLSRRAGEEHRALLATLLREDAARQSVDAAWREQMAQLSGGACPPPASTAGLAAGLRLATVLFALPQGPGARARTGRVGTASGSARSERDHRRLATVRALLAKAESTRFDEEAEALTAKAQELISRYALEGLLDSPPADAGSGVGVRRIWLDAPYVAAKAGLVDEVAKVNRCRSVFSERLEFCTVVGDPRDLDAVDLLVTSLLVQGSAAMVRHGRHVDITGVSRTRSFRQSFLVSYAVRIGERLREASSQVLAETGDESRLLPVLARREEHVEAAVEAMFPDLVERPTSVTNGHGWAAGRAAAELALLDVRGQVTDEARSAS
jgi:hypothetical protein